MSFIPLAEYALWRGVGYATIYSKVHKRVFPPHVYKKIDGKLHVDKELADQILNKISKSRQMRKNQRILSDGEVLQELEREEQAAKEKPSTVGKQTESERSEALKQSELFYETKAEKERVALELSRVKLDEQRGNLIKADIVKKAVMKAFGDTKEQLLNIPDQLGPELLACSDIVDLQTKLQEAINKALGTVSDRYLDEDSND